MAWSEPVADPEGVHSNPLLVPIFYLSYENEIIETELFHFHGIFGKNEIKSAKRTTHTLYVYEPPFQYPGSACESASQADHQNVHDVVGQKRASRLKKTWEEVIR